MNTTASLLEQLIECGTPAHLVAAVAKLEADAAATEARRTCDRERKQAWRASLPKDYKLSADVPGRHVTNGKNLNDFSRTRAPERAQEESYLPLEDKKEREEDRTSSGSARVRARPDGRGTRLPEDWEPSEASRGFAMERLGSAAAVQDQLAAFRDCWRAHAGPTAVKRDWDAAFRNWCRKAKPSKLVMSPRDRKLQEHFDVRDTVDAYLATHGNGGCPEACPPVDGLFSFKFDRAC